jgi:hypothetical protein
MKTKWQGRRPALTFEQYAAAQAWRKADPASRGKLKDLVGPWGFHPEEVRKSFRQGIKQYDIRINQLTQQEVQS